MIKLEIKFSSEYPLRPPKIMITETKDVTVEQIEDLE